tara:strand:+ start:2600 stop:3160 length:561 start_codon:yes stop_codon:yes gene_type:complete
MKYQWVYYTNNIDNNLIDAIVKFGLDSDLTKGQIRRVNKPIVKKNIRTSEVSFIEDNNVINTLYSLVQKANNNAFGFDLSGLETPQFALYSSKVKGHYDWHTDTQWINDVMFHRKLTIVVQLSDPHDYEGGVFEIEESGATKKQLFEMKKKGSVIIFPSFLKHRVTPVTKGKRLSLTGWAIGSKFR